MNIGTTAIEHYRTTTTIKTLKHKNSKSTSSIVTRKKNGHYSSNRTKTADFFFNLVHKIPTTTTTKTLSFFVSLSLFLFLNYQWRGWAPRRPSSDWGLPVWRHSCLANGGPRWADRASPLATLPREVQPRAPRTSCSLENWTNNSTTKASAKSTWIKTLWNTLWTKRIARGEIYLNWREVWKRKGEGRGEQLFGL